MPFEAHALATNHFADHKFGIMIHNNHCGYLVNHNGREYER